MRKRFMFHVPCSMFDFITIYGLHIHLPYFVDVFGITEIVYRNMSYQQGNQQQNHNQNQQYHPQYGLGPEDTVPLKDDYDDIDNNNVNNNKNNTAYRTSTASISVSGLDPASLSFKRMKNSNNNNKDQEMDAVEALSMRLLAIDDDDSDEEDRIIQDTINLLVQQDDDDDDEVIDNNNVMTQNQYQYQYQQQQQQEGLSFVPIKGSIRSSTSVGNFRQSSLSMSRMSRTTSTVRFQNMWDTIDEAYVDKQIEAQRRICTMIGISILIIVSIIITFYYTVQLIGPPSQPVGPYTLIELQEGTNFFNYYTFYEGPDSIGSNGYLQYVSKAYATTIKPLINVTFEVDTLNKNSLYNSNRRRRRTQSVDTTTTTTEFDNESNKDNNSDDYKEEDVKEPFVYIGTAPTDAGPRDSIRLEGIRRFDRGLFIIDVRHMPAGCGVWPAFWLTDEANWPVNGEIDIVEGVNYQSVAKTALHSTKGCSMYDIPLGTMTGEWDTAQGIPDKDTGVPDMTLRYAQNCFVYDPHQWLNQGCVAVDKIGNTLGQPLNDNGGGVYVLEWDPINRHIRTWVFTPYSTVPINLAQTIATANLPINERIVPDPNLWPIPYGYFAIGEGTDCPAYHFKHMRLVLNTAFCGSVAGNRFFLDCPNIVQQNFTSCNDYIKSNPSELDEAYWKIRGVYVYQREWRSTWLY